MKPLALTFCFLVMMADPAYPASNQFWAKYFRECSSNWSQACEENYLKSINDECKENAKLAKRYKVKRKHAVCRELDKGK